MSSPSIAAAATAIAAGAILAMLADTMIPEAFEAAHDFAGFITVLGFMAAFALSKSNEPQMAEKALKVILYESRALRSTAIKTQTIWMTRRDIASFRTE